MTGISRGDTRWPRLLTERIGDSAPPQIWTQGNLDLLALPKTALFCSARCPGHAILSAYDQAVKWRDTGRCVISGFHSSVEKEWLQILLRGSQPIIICPARSLPRRAPPEWKKPLADGRLLVLSAFADTATRVTALNSPSDAMSSSPLSPTTSGSHTSPPAARWQNSQASFRITFNK